MGASREKGHPEGTARGASISELPSHSGTPPKNWQIMATTSWIGASVCPTTGKSWELKSLPIFLPLWTPFPQRSWVASKGTPFWLQAWYTSLSPSSGLDKPCPGCFLPQSVRLQEEEVQPGKNNALTTSSLWLERKAEGTGSTFPSWPQHQAMFQEEKGREPLPGKPRPPAPLLPTSPHKPQPSITSLRETPPPSQQNPSSFLTIWQPFSYILVLSPFHPCYFS